jgi:hypothetical protein
MTALAPIPAEARDLPALIDRAATMLSGARTAAEVLEAREAAGLAYDVAKRAARLSRAKAAHDDLIAAAHRAQADALEIEAAAMAHRAAPGRPVLGREPGLELRPVPRRDPRAGRGRCSDEGRYPMRPVRWLLHSYPAPRFIHADQGAN